MSKHQFISYYRTMGSSSTNVLFATVLLIALLFPLSSALELYGCYLPDHRPDKHEIFAFIKCIHNVNGVRSADGGRWGRSLRHINKHRGFANILMDDIVGDIKHVDSPKYPTTTNSLKQEDSELLEEKSTLLKLIGFHKYVTSGSTQNREWTATP